MNLYKIWVLVQQGSKQCLEKWTPTAEYLTSEIPGRRFTIVPLGYDEISPSVERKKIDFDLVNSSLYVEMEILYGTQRIATLTNLRLERACAA